MLERLRGKVLFERNLKFILLNDSVKSAYTCTCSEVSWDLFGPGAPGQTHEPACATSPPMKIIKSERPFIVDPSEAFLASLLLFLHGSSSGNRELKWIGQPFLRTLESLLAILV